MIVALALIVVLAATNWGAVGSVGAVCVALVTTGLGFMQGRKADRTLGVVKMTELAITGHKDLVDQLQEERDHALVLARTATDEKNAQQRQLESQAHEIDRYRRLVGEKETIIDNQQADIVRLKRQTGEL